MAKYQVTAYAVGPVVGQIVNPKRLVYQRYYVVAGATVFFIGASVRYQFITPVGATRFVRLAARRVGRYPRPFDS
jgi:hypothetical protein